MRIGISLLCVKKAPTGTDKVACNLVQHLAEVDDYNEYVIFANRASRERISLPGNRFTIVQVDRTYPRLVWLWEHLFFHADSRSKKLDVLHFPIARGVLGYRGKTVLTVHDLNAYLGLYGVQLRQRFLYRAWYRANLVKASRIVTVSESVKRQILEQFPVGEDRVRVVYNGVDERFVPATNSASFRNRYGLPEEYLLFVGSSYGNKNLERIIKAFLAVRQHKQLPHHLVIAGAAGDAAHRVQALIRELRLADVVHCIGYFPDEDLPSLYSHASLLAFATLAEGFGIPALEAMACGTPVVASDIPVFREVLNGSAVLVNPYSVDAIAEGLEKALLDSVLRKKLIGNGYERARKFSWRRMARDMVAVYQEAFESN